MIYKESMESITLRKMLGGCQDLSIYPEPGATGVRGSGRGYRRRVPNDVSPARLSLRTHGRNCALCQDELGTTVLRALGGMGCPKRARKSHGGGPLSGWGRGGTEERGLACARYYGGLAGIRLGFVVLDRSLDPSQRSRRLVAT